MIEIELNGAPHLVTPSLSLQQLIDSLALSGQTLAVAVNREVVPRGAWVARALQARDRVDVVRAIGGG